MHIHPTFCLVKHIIYHQKLKIILKTIYIFDSNNFLDNKIFNMDDLIFKHLHKMNHHYKVVQFGSSFTTSFDVKSSKIQLYDNVIPISQK